MDLFITNKAAIEKIVGTLRRRPKTPIERIRIYSRHGGSEFSEFDFLTTTGPSRHTDHEFCVSIRFNEDELWMSVWNCSTRKETKIEIPINNLK
jgi:hypothetical protein